MTDNIVYLSDHCPALTRDHMTDAMAMLSPLIYAWDLVLDSVESRMKIESYRYAMPIIHTSTKSVNYFFMGDDCVKRSSWPWNFTSTPETEQPE